MATRLECLKLAVERCKIFPHIKVVDIVDMAQEFVVFCEQDTKSDNSTLVANPIKPSGGRQNK
jgi:hypothetical protein